MNQHDDRDAFDQDDDLRAQLRSADPAASLGAADPMSLTRLVEATTAEDRRHAGRRGPLTWLAGAAAAAVVVTAGVGALHDSRGDHQTSAATRPTSSASSTAPPTSVTPTSTGPTSSPGGTSTGPQVSTLTVSPAAFDARCAVPNAAMLGTVDTAFAGTVTAVTGNRVTLQRADTFRGNVADTVTVRAPARDLSRLVQSVRFKVGGSYLVSATGGQVALCGFTGPAQQDLQGLYSEAFPR